MNGQTTIDLLRHGEPVGGRRYRGQIDDPLSDNGWQEMWHAVSGEPHWQQIISSPLSRCLAFAEALSQKLEIPLQQDDRLKEVGFGNWEGKSSAELRALDPQILARFYRDPLGNRPAGAEPLEAFSLRVVSALDEAIETHAGKHLLIVTHAGVIRAALANTLSAPIESLYRLSIASASISRIQLNEERPASIMFLGRETI
ncbi:MAG: alpha-ribazole phosphatase family protein [gamma proteobacterium endosymbiont of Lamellibrachia anaximandri]|nr:alpha-ribazole phosphatase family protein [gamma proteobacterium endosymbiont of Lamellibrachia anaximandri]MBL3533712.1 alpha-ribazole phosphatase family protein [gamma proteobacterium endosymbiont of Lamellibrachia anaximandri]